MNKELTIFTAVLVLLTFATGFITVQFANPSFMILILTVLAVATWLVYYFIHKSNRQDFIKNYLLTIVVKLLAGGIFVLIILYIDKAGANSNATLFTIAYFLFTGVEVGFLFRRLG